MFKCSKNDQNVLLLIISRLKKKITKYQKRTSMRLTVNHENKLSKQAISLIQLE